jgi:hypothetical protein
MREPTHAAGLTPRDDPDHIAGQRGACAVMAFPAVDEAAKALAETWAGSGEVDAVLAIEATLSYRAAGADIPSNSPHSEASPLELTFAQLTHSWLHNISTNGNKSPVVEHVNFSDLIACNSLFAG